MKKLHLLQCFDVTDAVKDGIEDFNRLSGYTAIKRKKVITPFKKSPVKNVFKLMALAIIALIMKVTK
jgi:hypothetical protein